MFRLDGKTAIVTGGASGIGLAISQAFAQQGATVHILELNDELATQEAQKITEAGGKVYTHGCDIANIDNVKAVIDAIAGKGKIDILVNNAGIAHIGNVENTTGEDLDRVYNVNVKGLYNCVHAAIPYLKERGGTILNMASIASHVGIFDRFAYSMSKGAVLAMTYSIAKDYVKHGIRCNSISPARVHTPFVDGFIAKNYAGKEEEMLAMLSQTQPIGRMAKPKEVASLAVYLCSDEASFITGTDYPLDGGFIKLNGN